MARLGDIFNLQMGKTPSRNNPDYWNDGIYNWISIADIGTYQKYTGDTKEKISELAVHDSGIKLVPTNTVIMSFKLSLGKTAITKEPTYTNEAIMAFIPTGKYDILPDYFYHLFSVMDWLKKANRAVMGSTLNKATLGEISVTVPSLNEQRKIAMVMDKITNLIFKRRQQMDKLDEMIKSRFVEMFGDPAANPKGWKMDQLGTYMTTLTDFSANGSYELLDSHVVMYDEPNYAVMIRTTDLESGDFVNGVKYIDQSAYELLSKSKLYGGELIMNKIGSAGKIYIMPHIDKPASLGRNAFMFRFDKRINMTFLYALLTSDYGTAEIQQYVRGAVTKTITKAGTRAIRIMVPPIELQNQFSTFVDQTKKIRNTISRSLKQLETLKRLLMQEYFG